MFQKIKNNAKIINIWYLIFSVLFGIMLVVSRHTFYDWRTVVTAEDIFVSDFHLWDIIALFIYVPIIYMIMQILCFLFQSVESVFFGKARKQGTIIFISCLVFFMVMWIPYFMSYWPGGIYSDTVDSINMALGKKALDNHHPLLYTMLWKVMFGVTGAFDGRGEYGGLKLFTVVQTVILALALSGFIAYCYKKGVNKIVIMLEILFIAVFPLYAFYGISLWKDTIFSVVMFIFSTFLYNLSEENQGNISNKNLIIYGVLTGLIIFLRNNGIYISIFYSAILCLLCLKNHWLMGKKIGFVSFAIIVTACVIQGPIYDKFGYNIDTSSESLGIPLQQVAYIYTTDGNVNEEEIEVLNKILPLESWKSLYNPVVVDYLKFNPDFNKSYFEENAGEFLKVYIGMVLRNPVKAVKAYCLQTMGFWDIFKSSPTAYICNAHFGNVEYFMSDYFTYYSGISFRKLVEPRTYISSAIFVWLMLGTFFICLGKRNYGGMVCILPTLGLWLTIMIAVPVAFSFRYVYSLFLCVPLYIMVCIQSFRKKLQ